MGIVFLQAVFFSLLKFISLLFKWFQNSRQKGSYHFWIYYWRVLSVQSGRTLIKAIFLKLCLLLECFPQIYLVLSYLVQTTGFSNVQRQQWFQGSENRTTSGEGSGGEERVGLAECAHGPLTVEATGIRWVMMVMVMVVFILQVTKLCWSFWHSSPLIKLY